MRHDSSIPHELHTGTRDSLKDALGSFWSSVFQDQDLVDTTLAAKVLAASQMYINAMEALSLRDHSGSPVFHREHWHPMVVRLSERNTGRGIAVGMRDTPVIGAQSSDNLTDDLEYLKEIYLDGSIFEVGGNASYSKVNTYPIEAMQGCNLVGVKTCICDSISAPAHILTQDRDFSVCDGVLVIRKEQDPFDVSGYRTVEDVDDKLAVLWLCDAEFDTNNVADFIGYPLGIDAKSTEASHRILSALWDVVVFGIAPRYLNAALGALFDVPTATSDSTIEQVTSADSSGYVSVITSDTVYRVLSSKLRSTVTVGAELKTGDFLTNDITVYHSLSQDEISALVDSGELGNITLPPGSVYGVDESVVIESRDSEMKTGGWFMLNDGDTGTSAFWTAVRARKTVTELTALFNTMANGGTTVNPMKAIGYVALANRIVVRASCGLSEDGCAVAAFQMLCSLVPAYASLVVSQRISVADSADLPYSADSVSHAVTVVSSTTDTATAASDDVTFTFLPVAETEV